MQIAALNPRFWDKSQVSQDVLDEEKKIMMAQMANDPKMASKPEQVREKIVMGKLNKFYSENCLLQQEFVRGDGFTGVPNAISPAKKFILGWIYPISLIIIAFFASLYKDFCNFCCIAPAKINLRFFVVLHKKRDRTLPCPASVLFALGSLSL